MKYYIKGRSPLGSRVLRRVVPLRNNRFITEEHSTEGIKRSMLLRYDALKRYGRNITDEQAFLLDNL